MNTKIKKFLKKASCFGMGTLAFVGAAFGNVSLYSNNNYLVSANETPAAYVYREGSLNNNEHQKHYHEGRKLKNNGFQYKYYCTGIFAGS